MRGRRARGDGGPRIAAIEREFLFERGAGKSGERRVPIDHVQRCIDGAAGFDVAVPRGEGAHAYAAFIERALAGAERAVAGDAAGRGAAVVAGPDDEGVLADPFGFKSGDDLADGFVFGGDHAGVGATWFRQRGVGFFILFRDLVGRVNGVKRHVKKQRLIGRFFLDQANSFAGDEVGRVTFVAVHAVIAVPIKTAVALVGVVVDVAVVVTVLVVEAAAGRKVGGIVVTEVPFADDGGGVTGGFEHLRQGAFFERQAVLSPRADDADL